MDVQQTADWINVLGDFCGMRDVPALTREQLKKRYGWEQADVMVLFGGSILCGAEVLARAMQEEAAKRFLISLSAATPKPVSSAANRASRADSAAAA